jgi:hypothetical protein
MIRANENNRLLPYCLVSNRHQRRHRTTIKDLTEQTVKFCQRVGINLKKIEGDAILNPDFLIDNPTSIEVIINDPIIHNKTLEETIFDALKLKDELNLSRRDYKKLRCHLGKTIPCYHKVHLLEKKMNSFFKMHDPNNYGVYVDPLSKIQFVCEKFLSQNPTITIDVFKLKISGDGTIITKSNVDLLNYTFTVINDVKTAKTSKGNYSLGKKNLISNYRQLPLEIPEDVHSF